MKLPQPPVIYGKLFFMTLSEALLRNRVMLGKQDLLGTKPLVSEEENVATEV